MVTGVDIAFIAELVGSVFTQIIGDPIFLGLYLTIIFSVVLAQHRATGPLWLVIFIPLMLAVAIPLTQISGLLIGVYVVMTVIIAMIIYKIFKA